jgi:hypothetical protein
MSEAPHHSPVTKLFSLGTPRALEPWLDYTALGLGREHIPALLRVALHDSRPYPQCPGSWAPLHAWRALGQLRATEAVAPLLDLLEPQREEEDEEEDWRMHELPKIFGRMGPEAIPTLAARLKDEGYEGSRLLALEGLTEIARHHPEAAPRCKAALLEQLEHFSENDPLLNAALFHALLGFGAVEDSPLMSEDDEIEEEEFELRNAFLDAEEARGRPREWLLDAASLCDALLDFQYDHVGGEIFSFTAGDVEEFLLGYFPQKLPAGEVLIERTPEILTEFFRWLGEAGELPASRAAIIVKRIQEQRESFLRAARDPRNFGALKKCFMPG